MKSPVENSRKRKGTSPDKTAVWGLSACFFTAALIFFFIPEGKGIPIPEPVTVAASQIDFTPRKIPGDPPKSMINGFERTCMDCHVIIDAQPRSKDLFQHANIQLEHGINTRCVTCHHSTDRNRLATLDNETFPFSQSASLCGECHGPVFRQWERGAHGKTLGFWNAERGESRRLTCTECHDPHHPRFDPIEPLPGPNTLRMGPQERVGHGDDHEKHSNPLLLSPSHPAESQLNPPSSDGH